MEKTNSNGFILSVRICFKASRTAFSRNSQPDAREAFDRRIHPDNKRRPEKISGRPVDGGCNLKLDGVDDLAENIADGGTKDG
jgi:hypothetical protein